MIEDNGGKACAVFVTTHPWMKKMIRQAAPPEFTVHFLDPADKAEVRMLLPQADFLTTVALPSTWVEHLERCLLVQLQGVGYDAIDRSGLAKLQIPLAATPEGTVVGVAEHTILLILALYKQLVPVNEHMRAGEYDNIEWRANAYFLHGKTLGIVGFGQIGQRVAHLARAFGTRTFYYDIVRNKAAETELQATYTPLNELLKLADIVSVHVALTSKTEGMFAADSFAAMKEGALFINTSRGRTYDMDALYSALESGHLGGAGLDVFNPEPPPPDHPILQLNNVVCTPHMATGTVDAHQLKARSQFENFRRVLRGEKPHNLVAPPETTNA